jgi:excisionase family DNA binding protein
MEKLLLTPEETAQVLSVGRSKVYELLASGELTSVRIGGSRRIPVHAVTTFIERLTPSTSSLDVAS